MSNFTPPAAAKVNEIASLIELIKLAGDKNAQQFIADMKKYAETAEAAQASAADAYAKTQKTLDEVQATAAKNTQDGLVLDSKRRDLDEANSAVDARTMAVADAEKDLAQRKDEFNTAAAKRMKEIEDKMVEAELREKEAAEALEAATVMKNEYEAKTGALAAIVAK